MSDRPLTTVHPSAGAPAISAETFSALWDGAVETYGARPFLVFEDRDGGVREWSFDEFDELVGRVGSALRAHGVTKGDAVHLVLGNCPAFVALWLAVARLGAWMVPTDPQATERDLRGQVERTRPRIGVCAAARAEVYRAATGNGHVVIELNETAVDLAEGSPILVDRADGVPRVEPREAPGPDDQLAVMWTSGTTSEPKGVVLTQANYAQVGMAMASAARLSHEHRWLVVLPLFHANAQYYCFASAIRTGASVALTAAFSASGWAASARRLGATHASLFAAPIRMVLDRTPPETTPLQLQHVWFAQNLGEDHYRQFAELCGVRPRQLYGMTETVAIVTYDRDDPPNADVIGLPLLGRQVRLVDPVAGTSVGERNPGMIEVLGQRGLDLFSHYLDNREATDAAFREAAGGQWFRTGDLATVDAEGRLRFVGRADDVIKVAGENVSLGQVEAVLAQAPGVLEVAVVARPDPVRDQVPAAFVVPRDRTRPPTVEQLTEWAARELAPASRPRSWTLVRELPRTSVGKIRRFAVGQAEVLDDSRAAAPSGH